MNSNYVAGGIVAICIVIGASPLIADSLLLNISNVELPANASVEQQNRSQDENLSLGLAASSQLRFGQVPENVNTSKRISLNAGPSPTLVTVSAKGNISSRLEFQKRHYFSGNRTVKLEFIGSDPGYYEGTVNVKTEDPRNTLGVRWLAVKQRFY
jgi:hypothetical protein